MKAPPKYDVAVIGGGIIGLSVAFGLAEAGLRVACVLGRGRHFGQSSRASGAMLGVFSEVSSHDGPEHSDVQVTERLASRRLYDDWLARIAARAGLPEGTLSVNPGLYVVANPLGEDDLREIEAIRDAASTFGAPVETVAGRDIAGFRPQRTAPAIDAVYLPQEGTVDSGALCEALEAALAAHPGCDLVDAGAVSVEEGDGGGLAVGLDSGQRVSAVQTVLATGADSSVLERSRLPELGLPAVFSGRGVSLVLKSSVEAPTGMRTPNRGFTCGHHLVPRAGGRIYAGATNRLSTTPDFDQLPTLAEIETVVTGVTRELNTDLVEAELESVWAGHRPVAVDKLPVVGRSAFPPVLVATGTYRNGMLLAPRVAELITQEVADPGLHESHAFWPGREIKGLVDWADALKHAATSLMIGLSAGELPPGKQEDMERFFDKALGLLLDPGADSTTLSRKLKRLMDRAPMQEAIPLAFETLIRHR